MPSYSYVKTGLTLCALIAAIVLLSLDASAQQTNPHEPINEPVHDIISARSDMKITERFSKLIKHKSMIKTVDGFDPEVIGISAIDQYTLRVQAKAAGVTNIIVVDEFNKSFDIEVFVEGDVRHLQAYIKRLFPDSSIDVVKVGKNVVLRGWVSDPDQITEIIEIAREFYPEPVNQMKLGGPNQIQLRVKVMEVQRSKIRQFGFNWVFLGSSFAMASTPGASMPLTAFNVPFAGNPSATLGSLSQSSLSFGITDGNHVFTGFLEALKREGLLKILAEPVVVTTSGRPANLLAGGEFPILVPQSLGTTTIQWREFGVILEAVPIILGNGNLRLEVAPEVSDRDFTNAVSVNGFTVPGLTTRRVNTQVEMKFGQTLVIGGLISTRETAETHKIPYLGDLPWVGAAFRRMRYDQNETELLIMVTPELVAPVDHPDQLPPGPGSTTVAPTERELYWQGLIEVPSTAGGYQSGPQCYPEFSSPIPPVQGEVMVPQPVPAGSYETPGMQGSPVMTPAPDRSASQGSDPWAVPIPANNPPVQPPAQQLAPPMETTKRSQTSSMSAAQVSWIAQDDNGKGNVVQADRYKTNTTRSAQSTPEITPAASDSKNNRRLTPANRNFNAPDPKF